MGICYSSFSSGSSPPVPHPHSPPSPEPCQEEDDSSQLTIRSTPRSSQQATRPVHLRERLIHDSHEDPLSLFDVVKQLGVGLSGSVHLVKSKKTGTQFALKLLEKSTIEEDDFENFMLEVSLLRELDHPHIVRLVETFDVEDGKSLALLMEYLSGGELYAVLNEQPDHKFAEADAAMIMRQTVSAVAFLHSQGIVHRDLKLENFLFTKVGGKVVKLIDLGLSRRYCVNPIDGGGAIRRMHSVVGTPYYIAPEILHLADHSDGKKDGYDSSIDSWSLGVIAYMLLSGAPPFKGLRDNEVLLNVKRGKYTLSDKRWEGISELAKDFVRKLLVYDPRERLSASDALKHPWLLPAKVALDAQPLPEELVPGLRRFSTLQGWQRAVLEAVAFSCPDEEVEHLRGAFQRLDKHDIGYLSMDDFCAALGMLGVQKEEAEELFTASALGNHEGVHWNSFIAAVLPRNLLSKERLQEAFDALDVERQGYLTRTSFAAVLADDIEDVEYESLFEKAGEKVYFKEFLEAFENNSPYLKGRTASVLVDHTRASRAPTSSLDLRGLGGAAETKSRGSIFGLAETRGRGSTISPLLILETPGSLKSGSPGYEKGGFSVGLPVRDQVHSLPSPSPLRLRAPSSLQASTNSAPPVVETVVTRYVSVVAASIGGNNEEIPPTF